MLKERLESIKNLLGSYNRYDATREILNLAYDYDLEDYVENIIEESMINEIIQDRGTLLWMAKYSLYAW